MGVPAFFRWLSKKYPQIIVDCYEESGGPDGQIDATQPNSNGVEFDNLYLDMNGIIHPCCHPEGRPAPKNEDEMMVAIFHLIDRLFNIVRPRRVLYMAIDGVAPRAKMNQQRSRRFRAIKDSEDRRIAIDTVREELIEKGMPVPPQKASTEHFDSNCITPGTPFMANLAEHLRYYIYNRLNTNPAWKDVTVILSDANAPGEGEHKIMDFIRRQRASPNHDPNTQHCLCGADADLIMLGLATHEPNFTIIREEFKPGLRQIPCGLCHQYGHQLKDCQGLAQEPDNDEGEPLPPQDQGMIFVRLAVLREYLEKDLQMPNLPFIFDLERAIDDWVFMCFFVGNDFLPHLPSLEIREHAIDRLVRLYKDCVYKTGGWLTDSGNVNLERVQIIVDNLGEVEDEIFKKRHADELRFRERRKQEARQKRLSKQLTSPQAFIGDMRPLRPDEHNMQTNRSGSATRIDAMNARISNFDAAISMKSEMRGKKRMSNESTSLMTECKIQRTESDLSFGSNTSLSQIDDDEEELPYDEVRLHENGWKERYYQSKFEISADDTNFRSKVARAYVEGLCWVLKYYYQGCASWKWFFPYHYAPFASDFSNVCNQSITFPMDTVPFKPLEQLMAVFPAGSRRHVPPAWQNLFIDIRSPVIDFYPSDFVIDLNGKKYDWQGVALLPFIEEERLLGTLKLYYDKLTNEEKQRNIRGPDRIFVSGESSLCEFIREIYRNREGKANKAGFEDLNAYIEIDSALCNGMSGLITTDVQKNIVEKGEVVKTTLPDFENHAPDIAGNSAISCVYKDPQFKSKYHFKACRLPGAQTPEAVLKPGDYKSRGFRSGGFQFGSRGRSGGFNAGGGRDARQASISDSGRRELAYHTNTFAPRCDNEGFYQPARPRFNNQSYNNYDQHQSFYQPYQQQPRNAYHRQLIEQQSYQQAYQEQQSRNIYSQQFTRPQQFTSYPYQNPYPRFQQQQLPQSSLSQDVGMEQHDQRFKQPRNKYNNRDKRYDQGRSRAKDFW